MRQRGRPRRKGEDRLRTACSEHRIVRQRGGVKGAGSDIDRYRHFAVGRLVERHVIARGVALGGDRRPRERCGHQIPIDRLINHDGVVTGLAGISIHIHHDLTIGDNDSLS